MVRSISTRKAQTSTIDFIVSVVIMVIAIIMAVSVIHSLQEPSGFDEVQRQAYAASERLMSEGYPLNWNVSTVIQLGLLSDDSLNSTKLSQLYALPYQDARSRIAGNYQFYIYFENTTDIVQFNGVCGYGSPSMALNPSCEPDISTQNNVVQVERLLVHSDTIIKMVVLLWD